MSGRLWPWQKRTRQNKDSKKIAIRSPVPSKEKSSAESSTSTNHASSAAIVQPFVKDDQEDAPSTSPATNTAPPAIEYMREGMDADDQWMMVEDELEMTARLFTRHLHHQEYMKHKNRVAARGRDAIESIERAVDGRTVQSNELKLRKKANAYDQVVEKELKRRYDSDDTSEEDLEAEESIDQLLSHQPEQSPAFKEILSQPRSNVATTSCKDDEDSSDDLGGDSRTLNRNNIPKFSTIPPAVKPERCLPRSVISSSTFAAKDQHADADKRSRPENGVVKLESIVTEVSATDAAGVTARLAARKAAMEKKRAKNNIT